MKRCSLCRKEIAHGDNAVRVTRHPTRVFFALGETLFARSNERETYWFCVTCDQQVFPNDCYFPDNEPEHRT